MKITAIRATPFAIPLARAIGFGHGRLSETKHVLVEVETDEGITGVAEAPSRPFFYGESQRSIVAAIDEWFAPALVGTDPFCTGTLWQMLDRVEHNNTAKGAIDIALHDIVGKALGVPCFRLMGATAGSARATYVVGYSDPGAMVEEALEINERHGIDAFKVKVGVAQDKDGDTLRRMRRALPGALIYVDGNEAFDRQGAMRLLSVCAENGVAWAEEPCPRSDRAARRAVGATGAVPILGDESCRTPGEIAREIEEGTVQLVSIKVARTGYARSRDIVGLCAGHGIGPMVGSQGDSGIGVLAGGHFCAAHSATAGRPGELSFHLNLADDILTTPPRIEGGRLILPDSPGLGAEIARDRLRTLSAA